MAKTEIRGGDQIKNLTVLREDLVANFLGGADWDISGGTNSNTITGLANGVNADDAVNKSQLDELAAQIGSPMRLKGAIDVATPTPDLDAIDNAIGDYYIVTVGGTYLGKDWSIGDNLIVINDVAAGATITSADVIKVDNTESDDLLRTGDVVDNVSSTGVVDAPLSANQGYVLDQKIVALQANSYTTVYGEEVAVTQNQAAVGLLSNAPTVARERVFLNGLYMQRGSGNDYTISGNAIVFEYNLKLNDKVLVDYDYL